MHLSIIASRIVAIVMLASVMSFPAFADDGTIVGQSRTREGEAHFRTGFVWQMGTYRELRSFGTRAGTQPCDAG